MDAEGIRSLFRQHCRATAVWVNHENHVAAKLCCMLDDIFTERVDTFFQQTWQHPVLVTYQSDATSALLTCSDTSTVACRPIIRKGRHLYSLLLERALFMCRVGDSILSTIVVKCARPLQDKSTWAEFTAQCECMDHPRGKHLGILILHVCFDRAVFESLARKQEQRSKAFYMPENTMIGSDAAPRLELLEWNLRTACALHDVTNAFKWGVGPFHDADVLSALHVVLESLRNCRCMISGQLDKFCLLYLRDGGAHRDLTGLESFWGMLGVADDMLSFICFVDPRWGDGCLYVSQEVFERADCMVAVKNALVYIF
jgi:hypothetical protein